MTTDKTLVKNWVDTHANQPINTASMNELTNMLQRIELTGITNILNNFYAQPVKVVSSKFKNGEYSIGYEKFDLETQNPTRENIVFSHNTDKLYAPKLVKAVREHLKSGTKILLDHVQSMNVSPTASDVLQTHMLDIVTSWVEVNHNLDLLGMFDFDLQKIVDHNVHASKEQIINMVESFTNEHAALWSYVLGTSTINKPRIEFVEHETKISWNINHEQSITLANLLDYSGNVTREEQPFFLNFQYFTASAYVMLSSFLRKQELKLV